MLNKKTVMFASTIIAFIFLILVLFQVVDTRIGMPIALMMLGAVNVAQSVYLDNPRKSTKRLSLIVGVVISVVGLYYFIVYFI